MFQFPLDREPCVTAKKFFKKLEYDLFQFPLDREPCVTFDNEFQGEKNKEVSVPS